MKLLHDLKSQTKSFNVIRITAETTIKIIEKIKRIFH